MQKLLHLCYVCLHQWRVPKFALKYPCSLHPPRGETIAREGGGYQGGFRVLVSMRMLNLLLHINVNARGQKLML